ncbi:hypothetical protein [Streptomyces sp. NPDC059015]|uniref:hypothetical protein n=1 Tax=unclassified Streptomyces TaxID=2593676 RepID=UPI0036BE6B16
MIWAAAATFALGSACTERPTTHHGPGTSHDVATDDAGTLLGTPGTGHHERLRQVPAAEAPTVSLTVRSDTDDGWNVRIDTGRFRFSPDSVGGAAVLGSGHAHLFADGKKVARAYGRWHHLSADDVPPGTRTLSVRLYADDHTAWAVGGVPVQDTARLPGPAPDERPVGEQPDRTADFTITAGAVSPDPDRIELRRGDLLAIRVTSDTDDELHVHGVNRTAEVEAGRTTTLRVVLDRSGLFEVELHRSGLVLAQLAVR